MKSAEMACEVTRVRQADVLSAVESKGASVSQDSVVILYVTV